MKMVQSGTVITMVIDTFLQWQMIVLIVTIMVIKWIWLKVLNLILKTDIEKEGLVEQMNKYVEETNEVAADHIEGKFNKKEIKDDKKGGKITLKINTKKKHRTKNTRRRKYIKE